MVIASVILENRSHFQDERKMIANETEKGNTVRYIIFNKEMKFPSNDKARKYKYMQRQSSRQDKETYESR